jgi:hypothetical protein
LPVPVSPSSSTVGLCGSDLLDLINHPPHRRALTDDAAGSKALARFLLQVNVFNLEFLFQAVELCRRLARGFFTLVACDDLGKDRGDEREPVESQARPQESRPNRAETQRAFHCAID